jgi:ubiquinone/menaquinone biosynthesis C-methylase UbiE
MGRVLDLGCGTGNLPIAAKINTADEVVGVDVNEESLAIARQRFPQRTFERARGESLPFPDASFDRVVAAVALPYMNIPETLTEVHRVLVPGGSAFFSVHPLRFTLGELWKSILKPTAMIYRFYVLLNGLAFHLTGRSLPITNRPESFQTQRGLSIAFRRAGFEKIKFTRPTGRLIAEASTATRRP